MNIAKSLLNIKKKPVTVSYRRLIACATKLICLRQLQTQPFLVNGWQPQASPKKSRRALETAWKTKGAVQ